MYETIRVVESETSVARIVLNRPPLNVLNIKMLTELCSAVDELRDAANLRVVCLEAEGKAFSAGVDVADHVDDLVRPMIAAFNGLFRRLADLPTVTVALVDGVALGGGCELACFCDIVVASESAQFGQPEIELAVFPPVTAAAFPYFMNGKKVLELMLTGEVVDAHEAERIGLVNRVLPGEEFEAAAQALVEGLASKSAVALRLAKKAYYAAIDVPFGEGLDRAETIYLDELMKSFDANEGIRAFMEKRKPQWRDA